MKAIRSLFIKMFVCLFAISLVNGAMMTKALAAAKVSTAINWAVAVANDDRNGYSQSKRNKSNKLGGVEYDCSALVYAAYRAAGFSVSMGCTATMKSDFKKAGFTYISNLNLSSSSQLQKGDILWRSGHTEIYIGSNQLCGAHLDYDGKVGDGSGKEINIKTYYDNKWSGIFRYGSTSTPTTTEATNTKTTTTTAKSTNSESYNFSTGTYKTTGDVNMRSAANTTSSVLKVVSKGTKFTVTSVSGRFGKTTISGKTGYVSLLYADLVSATKTTATATATKATTSNSTTSSSTSSSSSSTKAKASKYSTGYYKLNDEMNLRTGPSTKYKLLVAIDPGTKVYVTEVSGNWGKITYKSKTGWIALTYSSKTTKYSTGTWKTSKKTYLRKSNSSSSKSLKTIKKGVKVKVTKVSGNWGKASYSGKTGWIYLPSTNAK